MEFCQKTQNSVKFSLKFRVKLSIFIRISYYLFILHSGTFKNFPFHRGRAAALPRTPSYNAGPKPLPKMFPTPTKKKIPGSATVFVSSCFMNGAKILIRKYLQFHVYFPLFLTLPQFLKTPPH